MCEPGFACSNGVCLPMLGADCSQTPCPQGLLCKRGVCVEDACRDRCPVDHACIAGECRHLQGLLCRESCPAPFECLNGQCARNGESDRGLTFMLDNQSKLILESLKIRSSEDTSNHIGS